MLGKGDGFLEMKCSLQILLCSLGVQFSRIIALTQASLQDGSVRKMIHLHSILFAGPASAVHRAANCWHSELVKGLQNGGHLRLREIN